MIFPLDQLFALFKFWARKSKVKHGIHIFPVWLRCADFGNQKKEFPARARDTTAPFSKTSSTTMGLECGNPVPSDRANFLFDYVTSTMFTWRLQQEQQHTSVGLVAMRERLDQLVDLRMRYDQVETQR